MKTKKERAHKYSKRKYTKTIPENKIPYNAQIKNNRTYKNVTLQHTNTMQLTQHKINPKQPNNWESTPMKFRIFEKTIFCLLFYFFSIKLRGNGVLKLLSPQNLGNFSFKESSKLKREITLKNLDGKFLGWLIKILNF